jgi:hypothetical protein
MSLGYSCGLEPFDIGYAYEALARATALAGNPQKAVEYLSLAQIQARLVRNAEHRALLLNAPAGLQAWRPARRCTRRALGAACRPRVNSIRLASAS